MNLSQYISDQEDILSNMVELLDQARRLSDEITDMTDEREPYGSPEYLRKQKNALALKLVAYTAAQQQMIESVIAYHDAKPIAPQPVRPETVDQWEFDPSI